MLVFVAGIHGVGKSYLCNQYAESYGGMHVSASQLIREERSQINWDSNKRVKSVKENQELLLKALARVRADSPLILLDGHFTLKNVEGKFEPVEEQVFADLKVNAVVLIEDDIQVIRHRLIQRDNVYYETDILEFMQQERKYMHEICQKLEIKNIVLSAPTQELFNLTINDMLR